MSQATVLAIAQDPHGFMWFATQEGLNRFDGVEFTVYTHDVNDPGSLSSDSVRAILVDSGGVLWVGTDGGGLNRFDADRQAFVRFESDPADPSALSHHRVRALHEDAAGALWVGTDGGGLNRLDRASGGVTRFLHDPADPASLSHDRVSSLLQDREGSLWVGTDGGGLCRLDPVATAFACFRHDPADPASLSDDRVRSLFEDANGWLWVGTYEGGLNRFDPATELFTHFRHDPSDPSSLSANRVRGIFQDSEGVLWVGTDRGLNEWLPGGRGFRHYRHDPTNPSSLSDDRVVSIHQDRGSVLWVGTYGGLNKWNPLTGSFAHYKHDPQTPGRLSSSVVMAFHEDHEGAIWIGTYGGGLNRFERRTGEFSHHRFRADDPDSLSDDRVMSLLVDSAGDLWVGTFAGGLNRFDRGGGVFERFLHDPAEPASLSANGVTALLEDRRGSIWVGTYRGGLNRYDPARRRFIRYRHDPADPNSLSSDRVVALHEDRAGVLWIGTDGGGLERFEPQTGRFRHFRHDPADPTSLSSDDVWTIHEDRRGTLWVGTRTAGLNRWEAEDRRARRPAFRRYAKKQGLLSSVVYGLLSDDAGNLWVSTNHGLSRLDPDTGDFRHFDTSHGLQSSEFNGGAYYRARDGQMFFGGPNGFNMFHPSEVRENAYVPPVVIDAFLKFNRAVDLGRPPWEVEEVELSHRDSVIALDFAALDYTAPEKNRYAYMLEGFDQEWVEAGPLRRATYTNLDAGTYTFRVRGSNNDGVWNQEGASLRIVVGPPPWSSPWAYGLYALCGAGLMLGLIRFQSRERRRAAELQSVNRSLERQIAGRERAQRELQKLSLAMEQSPASVMITDPEGRIEYVNPKFEEVTGYTQAEVLGRRPDFLKSGYTAEELYEELWQQVRAGRRWRGELHSKAKSGELFWEAASMSPIIDADGKVTHILAVNEDITASKEYEERLLHQAHFDQLTNLPNRVLALDRLQRAILLDRREERTVAVMFVDLDNFKIVNDTLGHATGDELLVAAARRLSTTLRSSDTVARTGGDEFLVLLPDLDGVADAEIAAGKLLQCFSQPFNLEGRDIFMTASIGVTVAPADGTDPHLLMRNADAAMFRAKEKGRNSYEFFTPAMNVRAMERLSLESNLRGALEKGELAVNYQPIIEVDSGEIVGAEALLAWQSPELGSVPADQFVPVAEDTGLIVPIGEWVLRTACKEARGWQLASGRPMRVAVNVSARQFKGADLVAVTRDALEESGLPADCLELEITERLLLEQADETRRTLSELHDLGVRLALDDFGTGYSALSYLKTYSFDILKIDRTFVRNLMSNNEDRAVVTAIIAMGSSLGLEVTGEGVETAEQLDFLGERGCDRVQGFLFSPAVASPFIAEALSAGADRDTAGRAA